MVAAFKAFMAISLGKGLMGCICKRLPFDIGCLHGGWDHPLHAGRVARNLVKAHCEMDSVLVIYLAPDFSMDFFSVSQP